MTIAAAALAAALSAVAAAPAAQKPAAKADGAKAHREFSSVNLEYKGQKVWTPSTFIVRKGERVRITLINDAPSGVHGFAIEGHEDQGAKVQVNNQPDDNRKVVEFTASKPGLYKVYCHMHPAHVGGQLLVLE